MIEMLARVSCDRCGRLIEMENVGDMNDVYRRMAETDWCDSDDGENVCDRCWLRWELARAGNAVGRSAE
jgi:hypothetical protein